MRPSAAAIAAAALLLGALAAFASPDAHAQWKWRDEQGRVHYADRPPPAGVPASRILHSDAVPGTGDAPSPAPAAAESDSGAGRLRPAAGPDAPASPAARAAQLRKRDAERDAQRRRDEQLAAQAAMLAEACAALRSEARTLESGMRLVRVDAQGERVPMTNEERDARLQRIRHDLRAHCPTG